MSCVREQHLLPTLLEGRAEEGGEQGLKPPCNKSLPVTS